ncbi:MAG: GntR family transcriptional regulator [Planctomycetia bacterium]|nr:GntR family transcriptional regulator [Planctomycetia bacterium]
MMAGRLIRSTREQITDLLRDEILCGRLVEGDRLSEGKLAERFGVSRGPIRESLVQLTQEGLLVAKPNCGVKVAPSATADVRELLAPIRKSIETYALKLIFDDLTEADFRHWEEVLQRMERACREKDGNAIVQNDIAFHRAILTRAGQADLLAIWQLLVARIRDHFQRELSDRSRDLLATHREHQELLAAFRGGDKKAAVRALEKHIT